MHQQETAFGSCSFSEGEKYLAYTPLGIEEMVYRQGENRVRGSD
jgi:hypothetical protein